MLEEASFVELTGQAVGSVQHRHRNRTAYTLCTRHMQYRLYMLQLERRRHTSVQVLGTMGTMGTSGYLLDTWDIFEDVWERHMQGMFYKGHTWHRWHMPHMSGTLEISYMVVGIEDIVGTVQMVHTVGMEIHNMLEPQLKINTQII